MLAVECGGQSQEVKHVLGADELKAKIAADSQLNFVAEDLRLTGIQLLFANKDAIGGVVVDKLPVFTGTIEERMFLRDKAVGKDNVVV